MDARRENMPAVLADAPGCWVALDRRTRTAVLMSDSPYKLTALIRERGLTGVAVVRSPDPSEPELVGLG